MTANIYITYYMINRFINIIIYILYVNYIYKYNYNYIYINIYNIYKYICNIHMYKERERKTFYLIQKVGLSGIYCEISQAIVYKLSQLSYFATRCK